MAKTAEEIRAQLRAKREADAKKDLGAVPVLAERGKRKDAGSTRDGCEARESTKVSRSMDSRGGVEGRSTEATSDIPPHSVESEMCVIGSMMHDARAAIPEVVAHLTEDYFYVPAHVVLYKAIVIMWDKGKPVDLVTVTTYLIDTGQIDQVGGPFYVTEVFRIVPTAANVGYYIGTVQAKYRVRRLIDASTKNIQRARENQDDVDALIDEAEQRIFEVGADRFNEAIKPMKDNVMRAIEIIESACERKGGVTGIATGFREFDRMTGGLHPAEMTVIAARPSMGKTGLMMNMGEHVAIDIKLPVAVFSLEMSTEQLTQRLLCSRARVNLQKVRDGYLCENDFPALIGAAGKFAESKLFIDDTSGLTILELRARARRLKAQHDIQLLIIDYLQLLRSNSKRGQENRQIEVTEISAGLKGLAKELKIPVVVAAQLNRQAEARQGGRPRLSDLRESGSIEQDADVVGLLYRPEVYEDREEARHECAGEAQLIIAKQRNGPIGEIPLTFLKEFTRFEDRAREIT
jgi:replicative DNA helicase